MASNKMAWVWGGMALAIAAGCSGVVREVGDATGGSGGAANTAGSMDGGSGNDHDNVGGTDGSPIAGGSPSHDFGGDGNDDGQTQYGGAGGDSPTQSAADECFAPGNLVRDGDLLELGPQNEVLLDVHTPMEKPRNSADQLVFYPGAWVWEAYANFPALDYQLLVPTPSLPADLDRMPQALAQFYVARRSCEHIPAAGHTLTMKVWWKTGLARQGFPAHGFALGAYDPEQASTTWFDDATETVANGAPAGERRIDTYNSFTLRHSFPEGDPTDAGEIVVGLWVADQTEFPSSFYVGEIQWDPRP